MKYIAQVIIIRRVNGVNSEEVISDEFSDGTTSENRRNAITYIKNLIDVIEIANEQGYDNFIQWNEIYDLSNFNMVMKSLKCKNDEGEVELIDNHYMDNTGSNDNTLNALGYEFTCFLKEVIKTGIAEGVFVADVEVDGETFNVFGEDLDWILNV